MPEQIQPIHHDGPAEHIMRLVSVVLAADGDRAVTTAYSRNKPDQPGYRLHQERDQVRR